MKFFLSTSLLVLLFTLTPTQSTFAQVIVDVVFLAADSNPNPNSKADFTAWETIVPNNTSTEVVRQDNTQVNILRAALENELVQSGVGTHSFTYFSPEHGTLVYRAIVE